MPTGAVFPENSNYLADESGSEINDKKPASYAFPASPEFSIKLKSNRKKSLKARLNRLRSHSVFHEEHTLIYTGPTIREYYGWEMSKKGHLVLSILNHCLGPTLLVLATLASLGYARKDDDVWRGIFIFCRIACMINGLLFLWYSTRSNIGVLRVMIRSFTFWYLLVNIFAWSIAFYLTSVSGQPSSNQYSSLILVYAMHGTQIMLVMLLNDALEIPWKTRALNAVLAVAMMLLCTLTGFLKPNIWQGYCFKFRILGDEPLEFCSGSLYRSLNLNLLFYALRIAYHALVTRKSVILSLPVRFKQKDYNQDLNFFTV